MEAIGHGKAVWRRTRRKSLTAREDGINDRDSCWWAEYAILAATVASIMSDTTAELSQILSHQQLATGVQELAQRLLYCIGSHTSCHR